MAAVAKTTTKGSSTVVKTVIKVTIIIFTVVLILGLLVGWRLYRMMYISNGLLTVDNFPWPLRAYTKTQVQEAESGYVRELLENYKIKHGYYPSKLADFSEEDNYKKVVMDISEYSMHIYYPGESGQTYILCLEYEEHRKFTEDTKEIIKDIRCKDEQGRIIDQP